MPTLSLFRRTRRTAIAAGALSRRGKLANTLWDDDLATRLRAARALGDLPPAERETFAYNRMFVSYARQDIRTARRLARDLRRAMIPIWFDEWRIPVRLRGRIVYHLLYRALRGSRAAIVVYTSAYENRLFQMVDDDGRPASLFANLNGLTRDAALRVDPALLFELRAFEYPEDSYSKLVLADFTAPEPDSGPKSRHRKAVYLSLPGGNLLAGTRVFGSFPDDDPFRSGPVENFRPAVEIIECSAARHRSHERRLIGENVAVSFSDYQRGLAAVIDELRLLPGEWHRADPRTGGHR
jgi:TIR domain-containing protein